MKDMITTVASLLILMIFVLQFSANQITHTRIFQADMAVESFRETLKAEGGMSSDSCRTIKETLSEICGCGQEDILVECSQETEMPAFQGMMIRYRIRFPLKNLIAMGTVLQIAPEDNMIWSDQEGWVVSLYEKPDSDDGNSSSDEHGDAV